MRKLYLLTTMLICTLISQGQITSTKGVKTNDAAGKPTTVGDSVRIRGVVTSPNYLKGTGLNFTLQDAFSGVTAYNSKDSLGYHVTEGDSIELAGLVSFYNGLTEITAQSIKFISVAKLPAPKLIKTPVEANESELVRVSNGGFYIYDLSQWTGAGSAFNVKFTNKSTKDTITVRIDNDIDLYSMSVPKDTYDIRGIVGQFDSKTPYFEGYQVFPTSSKDLIVYTAAAGSGTPVAGCTIADARKNDANGHPANAGSKCSYKGIVHTENFAASAKGLQFDLIDGTGAVTIYHGKKNFGYTPTRGDSVYVSGIDSFYNGLTEIYPDTVIFISAGNALSVVKYNKFSQIGEKDESYIVRLDSVYFPDTTQWKKGTGSGFNIKAVVKGVPADTFTVRIDNDVNLYNMYAPVKNSGTMYQYFTLTGYISQFDATSPYTSGYQLLPRDAKDIDTLPRMKPMPAPKPKFVITNIGSINTSNAIGVADSAGKHFFVKGIIQSDNFRPTGLEFSLVDATGSVYAFNSKPVGGYGPLRGDSVLLGGKIGQYNGLTQLNVDSVKYISSGNKLPAPIVATKQTESLEGKLITIKGLTMIDQNEWKPAGSGFNVHLLNPSGDTITMRIDADVNLFKRASGYKGQINVTGIASQFDATSPYTSGYQIIPRDSADIQRVLSIETTPVAGAAEISLYPNPTHDVLTVRSSAVIRGMMITDLAGRVIQSAGSSAENTQINVSGMATGVYILRVMTSEGTSVKRFVKE